MHSVALTPEALRRTYTRSRVGSGCVALVAGLVALSATACDERRVPADCGDDVCSSGEDCTTCEPDCGACSSCGDPGCDPNLCGEDCPETASAQCGDGVCDESEDALICAPDCDSVCGNGTCEFNAGENCEACEIDCGACETCEGHCGLDNRRCSCRIDCTLYGNCCSDVVQFCRTEAPSTSCEGRCDLFTGACGCDSSCDELGDCCADKDTYCPVRTTDGPMY